MTPRPRSDIHMNLPALRKLDAMLIESLDSIGQTEFWYAEGGNTVVDDFGNRSKVQGKKWWLPIPRVPANGLSDETRKKLLYQRDCISQIFKAAKSINEQVLSKMEVPDVYWDTLPKTGKSSLGDALYRTITVDYSSAENVLSLLDLSTEHNALEMANRLEAAIYTWKRRIYSRQSISIKDGKTGVKSSWSLVKESENELGRKELYMERADNILLNLKNKLPSIPETFLDITKIQYNREFWVRNEELVEMYEQKFHDAGYEIYKVGRTNNRGDGLFTAVRKDHFKVVNQRELLFHDFGDRVAQLLHLRSVIPSLQSEMGEVPFEALVVNTHLLFPHNSNYCLIRLRQVYKILEYLEAFKADYNLPPIPVILCGDWNGSKRGQVYKFLRSQGFVSSYDAAHNYSDNDKDAHKWISHRNHRGNICGVDFIWLLNPNKHRKLLRTSWMEAVFGIVKSKLKEAGLNDLDAFCFFKSAKRFEDYVTLKDFGQGLQQLGLTEQFSEGLTTEEIEDLMVAADLDGNGIIDSREFQKLMVAQSIDRSLEGKNVAEVKLSAPYFPGNSERPLKQCQNGSTTVEPNKHSLLMQTTGSESGTPLMKFDADSNMQDPCCLQETEIGFDVKRASLFPSEVEQGIWPENYLMSDHALLSAVFSPVKIPKSQKANL